jgi:hypothetical protein
MGRFAIVAMFGLCLAAADSAAETASESATAHYTRGIRLMTESPKDYAAAARAFERANELHPDPKNLFNRALALRLGGECRAAIESYRAYLATDPPAANANNAKIGIERCESQLAVLPTLAIEIKPYDLPELPEVVEKPVEVVRTVTRPGRDGIGWSLVVGGGAFIAASTTFHFLALDAAATTREPGPRDRFEYQRNRALGLHGISVISGAVGIGLLATGVYRLTRKRTPEHSIAITPTTGGAAVAIGGEL